MSSSPIESIVHCLAKAVEAARGLDAARSQNLCFALSIASSEAGRVAKAMRKAPAAKKPAKEAKKPEKAARSAASNKQQPQQSKSRSKMPAHNGAVAR